MSKIIQNISKEYTVTIYFKKAVVFQSIISMPTSKEAVQKAWKIFKKSRKYGESLKAKYFVFESSPYKNLEKDEN